MSYSFSVVSDEQGLRVDHEDTSGTVPRGRFRVNGHEPAPDTMQARTVGVTHTDGSRYIASSSGGAALDTLPTPAPAEPTPAPAELPKFEVPR